MQQRFNTLRDWRRWYVIRGKKNMITEDSSNPYIRRILRASKRYGWNCPFSLAIGRKGPEEMKFLQEWQAKQYLNEGGQQIGITAEERLLRVLGLK